MKVKNYRHPPQGTVGTYDPVRHANQIASSVDRMLVQIEAAQLDPEIAQLQDALAKRNQKEISRLIPSLKSRYGKNLFRLVKGYDRHVRR